MRERIKRLAVPLVKFVSNLYWPIALCINAARGHRGITILIYHSICRDGDGHDEWGIPISLFTRHMAYLTEKRYDVLTVDEAVACLRGEKAVPKKAVCITFDDGYRNNYTLAFPELVRYGFTATFYVATAFVDQSAPFPWRPQSSDGGQGAKPHIDAPLTWRDVRAMSAHGMVFGPHSHTHADFATLDEAAVRREIDESMRTLSQKLTRVTRTFATPFGAKKLEHVVRAHLANREYGAAFLGRFGTATPGRDLLDLPRMVVHGGDSHLVFKQKLAGAYNWLAPFHRIWRSL